MPLYNFQKRFAPKVRSGEKLQTICKRRKRPTVEGDTLYLYTLLRTKNAEKLREAECLRVLPVEIHEDFVQIGAGRIYRECEEMDEFAILDGFADAADFFAFWRDIHGLTPETPLRGFELIQWEPTNQ